MHAKSRERKKSQNKQLQDKRKQNKAAAETENSSRSKKHKLSQVAAAKNRSSVNQTKNAIFIICIICKTYYMHIIILPASAFMMGELVKKSLFFVPWGQRSVFFFIIKIAPPGCPKTVTEKTRGPGP